MSDTRQNNLIPKDLEEGIQKENVVETPKKFSWVKATLITFASILLIAGIATTIVIATKKNKIDIPILKKIVGVKDKSPFALHITEDKPRFPFTLKLSCTDVMRPHWIYSTFEESPYKTVTGNDYTYTSMTYQTNSERNLDAGIDLDFTDSSAGKLVGSIINFPDITFDFKQFQTNKTFKEAVWFTVQKEIVEVDTSNITFSSYFLSQLREILTDDTTSHDQKKDQLIEKFLDYGYYIPIYVGMGGKFAFTYEENTIEKLEEIAAEIKADLEVLGTGGQISRDKKLSSYASSIKITYYGGDNMLITEADNYDKVAKWMETISQTNYLPVNYNIYSPLAPIYDFFPQDIKDLFKEFKADVDEKFHVLYEKYKLYSEFAGADVPMKEVNTTQRAYIYGALPEYSPYIKVYKEHYTYEKTCLGRFTKFYSKGFTNTQKIVGFKLDQYKSDTKAGYFTLKENPLISSVFQVTFKSGLVCADLDYGIEIYYVDWATLD